jgi:hypothetical protein
MGSAAEQEDKDGFFLLLPKHDPPLQLPSRLLPQKIFVIAKISFTEGGNFFGGILYTGSPLWTIEAITAVF